jgi:hypothetical protein
VPILSNEIGATLGHKVTFTRLVEPITRAFATAIEKFARHNAIPMICFDKGQRKEELAARLRARFSCALPTKITPSFFGSVSVRRDTIYRTEKRRNPRTGRN